MPLSAGVGPCGAKAVGGGGTWCGRADSVAVVCGDARLVAWLFFTFVAGVVARLVAWLVAGVIAWLVAGVIAWLVAWLVAGVIAWNLAGHFLGCDFRNLFGRRGTQLRVSDQRVATGAAHHRQTVVIQQHCRALLEHSGVAVCGTVLEPKHRQLDVLGEEGRGERREEIRNLGGGDALHPCPFTRTVGVRLEEGDHPRDIAHIRPGAAVRATRGGVQTLGIGSDLTLGEVIGVVLGQLPGCERSREGIGADCADP